MDNFIIFIFAAIIVLMATSELWPSYYHDNFTAISTEYVYTIKDGTGEVVEYLADTDIPSLLHRLNAWNGTEHDLTLSELLAEFDNKDSDLYGYKLIKQQRTVCQLNSDDLDIIDRIKDGEEIKTNTI